MKSDLNPKLQPYLFKEYGSFNAAIQSSKLLRFHQGNYIIGFVGFVEQIDDFVFFKTDADVFRKLNGYGLLSDFLNSDVPFNKMRFRDKDSKKTWETKRENFQKFGITKVWTFGAKTYLDLSHFKCVSDKKEENNVLKSDQLSLDLYEEAKNEE